MNISGFISELKRRNVIRVATAYAIAGWLIIQVATSVFPAFNFPDWTTQFVIILVSIGLPIALIIAWAFELTPEGLKSTKEVDADASITHNTGKKLNGLIIAILSVALVFMIVERVFFAQAAIIDREEMNAMTAKASIAVLPFVNMSGDQDNEYFSDGLSEELLNGLAKLGDLQVAGRTSSFQYKGQNPDLRDVGEQLGVQHILEGSVRKSGNRVRITAQLIQADNGFHLWSETFDRELTANDIFDIQEEITRVVVDELKVRLLPEEEKLMAGNNIPTQDIEAYNAFLEATQLEIDRQPKEIQQAIERYQEAIRIDPGFALAYARLAYAYKLLWEYGSLSVEDARELVLTNAERALELNGEEGKAYQALGSYYQALNVDYDKAREMFEQAEQLLPGDAWIKNNLQVTYGNIGLTEKREETLEKAYRLDPLNPVVAGNYSGLLADREQHEQALDILNKILIRNPDYSIANTRIANILANDMYGRIDEAFIYIYDVYQNNRDDRTYLGNLFYYSLDLDMQALAEYFADQLLELYPENQSIQFLQFNIAFYNQDYEEALAVLENMKNRGADLEERYHMNEALSLYGLGKTEMAIQLIEKYNPELLYSEPEINNNNAQYALFYVRILSEEGRYDQIRNLSTTLCQWHEKEAEKNRLENKDLAAFLNSNTCSVIEEDYDKVVQFIEKEHFSWNRKRGIPQFYGLLELLFNDLFQREDFQKLNERRFADIHKMRDSVITYLKAEGEWRDEWEVTE